MVSEEWHFSVYLFLLWLKFGDSIPLIYPASDVLCDHVYFFNPLSANPTKCNSQKSANALKQFVGKLPKLQKINKITISKAVVRKYFAKEVVLKKTSQNSQESTCPGVLWACRVIKKETPVFPVNFQKCFRTAFYGTREDYIWKPYTKTKVSVSLYYYFMENCQPFLPQHL